MKRIAQFLIRLYPANWRERYGDEFEALIEDSPPALSGVLDLVKGAIEMRLTVPSFPKLALLLSLAGLLAGLGVSFLVAPRYISEAALLLEPATGSPQTDLRPSAARLQQAVLTRTSLAGIILDSRLDLYPEDRSHTPLEDVIETMRTRDIQIHILAPGTLAIGFAYRDRDKARATVKALIAKFEEANLKLQNVPADVKTGRSSDEIDRLETRIAVLEKRLGIESPPAEPIDQPVPAYRAINLEVLDPASLPTKAASPNRYLFMFAGCFIGFAMAIVIAIFRRRPQPAVPFPAATV